MIYMILVVVYIICLDLVCFVFLLILNKSIIFSDLYYVVDLVNFFNNVMEIVCNCWNMVVEKVK